MNILDADLSAVPIQCTILQPRRTGCGVWFCMEEFHRMLESRFDFLDIITFGVNRAGPDIPIRRAVIGYTTGRTAINFTRKPKEVKQFTDVHAKLVIGHNEEEMPVIFVGSHNFVGPTLHEIMLEVRDQEQRQCLLDYFESFWTKKQNTKEKA